jgi:hypothetical protein
MRGLTPLVLLLTLAGCVPSGGDDDDDAGNDGAGTITFVVDGASFTETADVAASLQTGFLSIVWNATTGGDLGEDYYGSLTLSDYSGPGSYAPVQRMTSIDAIIEIAGGPGSITYYPVGASAPDGGGSIEVDNEDGVEASGTFAFTGYDYAQPTVQAAITGTFDVTFGVEE